LEINTDTKGPQWACVYVCVFLYLNGIVCSFLFFCFCLSGSLLIAVFGWYYLSTPSVAHIDVCLSVHSCHVEPFFAPSSTAIIAVAIDPAAK
jgi:hypothetical protein